LYFSNTDIYRKICDFLLFFQKIIIFPSLPKSKLLWLLWPDGLPVVQLTSSKHWMYIIHPALFGWMETPESSKTRNRKKPNNGHCLHSCSVPSKHANVLNGKCTTYHEQWQCRYTGASVHCVLYCPDNTSIFQHRPSECCDVSNCSHQQPGY